MRQLRICLGLAGGLLPALLIGALVLLVLADVSARNLLQVTIPWAHDLAIVLLAAVVWFGLIGAAMTGQLFGVRAFVHLLPPRWQTRVDVLADLLVILIAALVIRAAYAQIATAKFTRFLALGWPKWIVALILALGMGGVILTRILAITETLRPDHDAESTP